MKLSLVDLNAKNAEKAGVSKGKVSKKNEKKLAILKRNKINKSEKLKPFKWSFWRMLTVKIIRNFSKYQEQ